MQESNDAQQVVAESQVSQPGKQGESGKWSEVIYDDNRFDILPISEGIELHLHAVLNYINKAKLHHLNFRAISEELRAVNAALHIRHAEAREKWGSRW